MNISENKLMINKELKEKVINNFLNLLVLNLADTYLDNLKNYQVGDTNEIILNFLDNAVHLTEKVIDINDEKLIKNIISMNNKQKQQFSKALEKDNIYKKLCIELNLVFWTIKEKEFQELIFNNLYQLFIKYDNDIINFFKKYQKTNIFQDLKLNFLNNFNKKPLTINVML